MKRKIFSIGFLLFAVHCLLFTNLFAQAGSTGWWIFRRPQSTKPKALTTVAAIRGDLSGIFYNPAVLGTIQQKEFFAMSELGMAQDAFGGLLYGQPIGEKSGLTAGIVYYDAGRTTLYYIDAGQERERTVAIQRDIFGIVSYGRRLSNSTLAGATFKVANSNIAEVASATAFAADLGLLHFTKIDGLAVSLVGQNIGLASKFLNKAEGLPLSVSLGASYSQSFGRDSYLGFGIMMPYIITEGRVLPSIGAEYGFGNFSFNLGYRLGAADSVFHIGLGVVAGNFDIGYSFVPAQYLSPTHRFSIGFRFGAPRVFVR